MEKHNQKMELVVKSELNYSERSVVRIGNESYLRIYFKIGNYFEWFKGLGILSLQKQSQIDKLEQDYQNLLAQKN